MLVSITQSCIRLKALSCNLWPLTRKNSFSTRKFRQITSNQLDLSTIFSRYFSNTTTICQWLQFVFINEKLDWITFFNFYLYDALNNGHCQRNRSILGLYFFFVVVFVFFLFFFKLNLKTINLLLFFVFYTIQTLDLLILCLKK